MDPLSDVLSLLKPQTYRAGGIDAGGDWSIRFDLPHHFTKCFAVLSGRCWLSMEGVVDALPLETGHCVVLPNGRPFRIASDLMLTPVELATVMTAPMNGRVILWNGGGACFGLGASFTFAGDHASILLGLLPPIVHIRNDSDRASLRWYMERMMKVLRDPQPGSSLLGQYLAQMILVDSLRLYVAEGMGGGVGWIFALADKQMNAAITAMHESPGRRWSLQELAEVAGMSRSIFALRFKKKVGTSAMEYLTRWRMLRAAENLVQSSECVLAIAQSFGYESESAFGLAFKKVMGCSPRRYCRSLASSSKPPSLVDGSEDRLLESADETGAQTSSSLVNEGSPQGAVR